MTKDELIEALVADMHRRETGGESAEVACDSCRAFVEAILGDWWPLIVEFVADWLGGQMHIDDAPEEIVLGHRLIDTWREEMT